MWGQFGFLTLFGVALLGVVLLYLPGSLAARLLNFSWGRSLVVAPVVSGALYLCLALLLPLIGVSWGWLPVLLLILGLAVAVFLQSKYFASERGPGSGISRPALVWGGAALVVYLLVQVPALLTGMGSADMFPQIGDAQFHLQGARLVLQSGNANPLSALSDLYASDGNTYYPTLWHSLVVLLSFGGNLILGTNALAVSVGLFLWPVTVGLLAQILSPQTPYAGAVAIMAAAPLVLMPGIQVFGFGVYPFVLSLVLVPGALAVFLWWLVERKPSQLSVSLISVAGGGAAQPATGAFLGGALLVVFMVATLGWSARIYRNGNRLAGLGTATGIIGVFVAGLLIAPQVGPLRSLGGLGHPSVSYSEAALQLATGNVYFIVERPFGGKPAMLLWALILLILLIGLWRLCTTLQGVAVVTIAALSLAAYLLASGPETYLRRLTAIWWKDQTRFALYLLVLILVAYAAGFTWLLQLMEQRVSLRAAVPTLLVGWLLVSAVTAVPLNWLWLGNGRTQWVDRTYGGVTGGDFGLTADHLQLLEEINDYLGSEDVVVGSPRDGAPWVNIVSGAGQFPLWKTETAPDEVYLRDHFDEIGADPQVCEIINDHGITALLRSETGSVDPDDPHGAFLRADTSSGFELLAQRGDVRLYEISACSGAR